MKNSMRLKDKIDIILITYNRCAFLQDTLRMLETSPFRECQLTILDNASPDDTKEVVALFSDRFPNMKYIRNRLNIGGNPNYLKAIEMASAEYTWILCDDDYLDFTDTEDVVMAIEKGEYDLVEIGAIERGAWPRGTDTFVRRLVEMNVGYYFGMGFFPAYIFKTALFDSSCFCWGYKHIDLLYPQFEFLNKSVREDFSIYLSRKKIVTRNAVNDHAFFPFVWYASWVACCRTIENREVRAQAIDDATIDRGFFKCLVFWAVLDKKLNKDGEFWSRLAVVFRTFNCRQRSKLLLVLPWVFLPVPIAFWVWIRRKIYQLKNVPENEIPPLRFLHRG